MVTVYDVDGRELVNKAAQAFEEEKKLQPPEWSKFVKSGVCAERLPEQENWWFLRGAAILRKVYIKGPIGVRELRKQFGKKKNMGSRPDRIYPSSGSVTRKLVQQLERAGFIVKYERSKRSLGRVVSPKGQKFLDLISKQVGE